MVYTNKYVHIYTVQDISKVKEKGERRTETTATTRNERKEKKEEGMWKQLPETQRQKVVVVQSNPFIIKDNPHERPPLFLLRPILPETCPHPISPQ